ncbi:MAG: glycosyltransferase family 2 protein [Gemmatimonadaceae bacterium]
MTEGGIGERPTIAVVVPTRDRPRQLTECLTAIAEQTYPPTAFRVIVVDDGSSQPLDAVVARFTDRIDVRVIRQKPLGAAAARNTGIAAARASVLAFTDDDCRPAPDWLARLAERFERSGALLVGGRVVNALSDNAFAVTSQLIHDLTYAHHNAAGAESRFFATNNLAVSRDAVVRVGGFDEGFDVASEDRDLCARWHESGHPLVYAADALVAHAHHLTLRRFWTQHFRYGRGAWRFHQELRRRGRGRFMRDVGFHASFLRRAGPPLKRRDGSAAVVLLLGVWQVANLVGFVFEAMASRLPSRGPAAKIS